MANVNITSILTFWRKFDLPQLQRSLDQTATDVAARQDDSDVSRRKLVEQMKLFKKSASEEVRKTVSPLLKSFQSEIDSLTKRSKACESDFLNLYKKLVEMPDLVTVLEQAEVHYKKNQRMNDIETENLKLRDTLADYNKEFAEVKNQEVTIKNLKEKIKELERDSSATAQKLIQEKHEQLKSEFSTREKTLLDNQLLAATKLSEAEQKANTLQAALDSSQSELFNLKAKYDEEYAGKQAELEMLVSDLDRANQMAEMSTKEAESLREQIHVLNSTSSDSERIHSSLERSVEAHANLEADLATKEKEVSQLVEDVQHLQASLVKLRETSASSIARLEDEIADQSRQLDDLGARLAQQSDYAELQRELNILKSTEFAGIAAKDAKSLEQLLLDKNKALQAENTSLRASNAHAEEACESLRGKLTIAEQNNLERDGLVRKLETDLMLMRAPASVERSAADGSAGVSPGLMADALNDAGAAADNNNDSSLLLIVSSQRERFRLRNNELEAENYTHQQTVRQLQTELDGMRGDNVKLYEKIKYLQSYPSAAAAASTSVAVDDTTATRYSSQYEEALDPFTSFSRKEKQRKYMNLSPPEKVTLGVSKMILSSKLARTVFFFYMLLMHCLLYAILYKYAYADDCKRHIADLCYEKFGAEMFPLRKP